jgi:glycosyltransferase involved in cell wall biosynthesis
MKIKFFPAVSSNEELADLFFRAAWHLNYLSNYKFVFYSENKDMTLDDILLPPGFSSEISDKAISFKKNVEIFYTKNAQHADHLKDAVAIIKWREDDGELNSFLKKHAKCTIYRTDPKLVRQEGSFYIQCAYDLLTDGEKLIKESQIKFEIFCEKLGQFKESWVLATGPSVDKYKAHEFGDSLVIACNSTIMDDELMLKCNPKILVFADPIFHFGVSEYAGKFRAIVKKRLDTTDITIVIPFKYYALLLSIFPEYEGRIIGVPFSKDIDFNVNVLKSFIVKTTSNILTLLLLPVASTFSKVVNLLGCDGRSFDEDDYFWGHGSTVQINDKMQNIQEVHPGFFKIDYNEYYYEHCCVLESLLAFGENKGISYAHKSDSFIPALRDRNTNGINFRSTKTKEIVLLEPDGVGLTGHYVVWHNQLISQLKNEGYFPHVFCSKKQDITLYECPAENVFTSHSWGISRGDWCFKKGFAEHTSFKNFTNELITSLQVYAKNVDKDINVFIYYGSIQILKSLQLAREALKKQGVNIKVSLCLFHESVILADNVQKPRFPPETKGILEESLARVDDYIVGAVTDSLSTLIYDNYHVITKVMPNPIPSNLIEPAINDVNSKLSDKFRVVFPCALRKEKGSDKVEGLIKEVADIGGQDGMVFVVRDSAAISQFKLDHISVIDNNISDYDYSCLLQSADIIVIPYLAPHFSYRTSGIIVDALFFGKPIIAIENTWLAKNVKDYRVGLSIVPYSHFSFLSAIKVIRQNYDFFKNNAVLAYDKYEKSNSWHSLVDIMLFRFIQ